MTTTDYLIWGIVLHLIADWVFQNDWMARNKSSATHPALYVHGFMHFLAMWMVFPYWAAVCISLLHMVIDTRIIAQWWQRVYRQTTDLNNVYYLHVSIWLDQVLHITVIAAFSLLVIIL